jgi:trans-aconitate methyltransferase
MGVGDQPVTLSPEQVAELNGKLSELRHNLNNHLTLILSAGDLIQRRPAAAVSMADTILGPAHQIMEEVQRFSREFERALRIRAE